MSASTPPPSPPVRDDGRQRRLLSFPRALAIAVGLEVAVLLYATVNWSALFPPPEPEPMKVEFVKLHTTHGAKQQSWDKDQKHQVGQVLDCCARNPFATTRQIAHPNKDEDRRER